MKRKIRAKQHFAVPSLNGFALQSQAITLLMLNAIDSVEFERVVICTTQKVGR